MEKNIKQKFTYVRFHTFIFTFAIVPIVVYIMHRIEGKDVDWISAIVGAGIVSAYSRKDILQNGDQ